MSCPAFLLPVVRLAAAIVLVCLISAPARAQPTATGTIEGRVLNVRTGEYLEGARLTLEGTTLETFSDSSGQYRFAGVPAGPPAEGGSPFQAGQRAAGPR